MHGADQSLRRGRCPRHRPDRFRPPSARHRRGSPYARGPRRVGHVTTRRRSLPARADSAPFRCLFARLGVLVLLCADSVVAEGDVAGVAELVVVELVASGGVVEPLLELRASCSAWCVGLLQLLGGRLLHVVARTSPATAARARASALDAGGADAVLVGLRLGRRRSRRAGGRSACRRSDSLIGRCRSV